MNHDILKTVIYDQHELIRNFEIYERFYSLEKSANYILIGLRRSGKSLMLYKLAQQLINEGVDWEQIIYVNFEDDRLVEFSISDFNDIVLTAAEMTSKTPYFFLDEIQIIDGWEKFARRLADQKQHVYITGSNAKMLSSEMESQLGGRYLAQRIMTYSFAEYLNAIGLRNDSTHQYTSSLNGQLRAAAKNFMKEGAFPEAVNYSNKRIYVENIYNKVLLGDIAARNGIRNVQSLRVLMKKIAETITSEVSYTKLHNAINSIGIKISKDSLISYVGYAEDAYLIFNTHNYIGKFTERESTPRYYFYDNGLLNLFLINKDPLLLENTVAIHLKRLFDDDFYYFKSSKTGIDIDFYIPSISTVIQVTYTLDTFNYDRETKSLIALSKDESAKVTNYIIVTLEDEEKTIDTNDIKIQVLPLYKFLLSTSYHA